MGGIISFDNNKNSPSTDINPETTTNIRLFGINVVKAATFNDIHRSDYVSIIINGYIRRFIKHSISGINQLCQKYYDDFPAKLIYFNDYNNWFKSIKHIYKVFNHSFRMKCNPHIQVLTQFIDETYQIFYVGIPDCHIRIAWKGFMCINTKTLDIHLIKHTITRNRIYLHISEPLQLNESIPTNYFGGNLEWFQLKNQKHNQLSNIKWTEWKIFKNNLWNLLMEYNVDTTRQEQVNYIYKHIWDIIKFYFVIKYSEQQCKHNMSTDFTTPYIGWIPGWNDTKNIKYEQDIQSKFKYYNQGNGFEVECHLFIDWGGGYSYSGGYQQCLYKTEFKMHKEQDEVVVEIIFICVKSCTRYGTPAI